MLGFMRGNWASTETLRGNNKLPVILSFWLENSPLRFFLGLRLVSNACLRKAFSRQEHLALELRGVGRRSKRLPEPAYRVVYLSIRKVDMKINL